jgi:hypothetical protein
MGGTLDYGYLSTPTGILNIAEIVCLIFFYIKERIITIRLIESNLYKKKRNRFQFDSIKIEVPSFIDI